MAAAYVTKTQCQGLLTAAKLAALFADDVGDAFLTQFIGDASELVRAAAARAYGADVLGESTANVHARTATFAVFAAFAYGRRDMALPERFEPGLGIVDALNEGKRVLIGVTADTVAAIGGATFSASDEASASGTRYNPFRRDKMGGY